MRQDVTGPNDEVEEYVDPVYTADNRHLPKMFDVLSNTITAEDSENLLAFMKSRLPVSDSEEYSENSETVELLNRPDDWDGTGVIKKIHDTAKEHIMNTYWMVGSLEPRKFMIVRTNNASTYLESYGDFDANGETLYTAVTTPCLPTDYFQGETRYTINGEGFTPNPKDVIVHRNEELNTWEITEVVSGERYDLIIVFQEPTQRVSYNFEIEQSVEDDSEF